MRGIAGTWLLTGEADREPIRDGAVVLDEHDRIVAVGPSHELRARYSTASWETHNAILTPGLINAHTHLELSGLRGEVAGGYGFVPWLAKFLEASRRLNPSENREAIDDGVGELLRSGTVAVGDVSNSLASVDALRDVPILARVFHEVFGLRRDTGETMLAAARQDRETLGKLPLNISCTLAPHTAYTLHPRVLADLVRAGIVDGPTSMHLAEHSAERAFLMTGGGPFGDFVRHGPSSPLDWEPPGVDAVRHADACGALRSDVIAVHVTDARPDEIALLAERGVPVVLCPRSNLFIEVKLPPLIDILSAGIQPGLGTDSLASCSSLDVLAEAAALHARFSSVAPRLLLAMATSFGARALRLDHHVGSLRVGLTPGVLAFAHEGAAPTDPERFVISDARRPRRLLSRPSKTIEAFA
jgi:cytosine/adenosine deaminase-related metal-dependent hydrolase